LLFVGGGGGGGGGGCGGRKLMKWRARFFGTFAF